MSTTDQNAYRSALGLALGVAITHVGAAMMAALAAFATASQIQLLDAARFGAAIPVEQAEARDNLQRLIAGFQVGIGLVGLPLFLMWVYRVNRNVRALGAEGLRYTPGWSVGWFFIPIWNLFMPYKVIKELWQANSSSSNLEWRSAPVSPVLGTWWAVGLLLGITHYEPWPVLLGKRSLARLMEFSSARAIRPSEFNRWQFDSAWEDSWGQLTWQILAIASSLLSVVVVLLITHFQEHKRALSASLAATEPAEMSYLIQSARS
jgi:hypothetical protein